MNKSVRRWSIGVALVLAATASVIVTPTPALAVGTTFWVDGSSAACTDAGTGAETTPFCTITAAAKKAVTSGDTVRIRPAVYREQVTVAGSGTPADPIQIVGDAPGVVVLGTRALGTAGLWTPTGTNAWATPYAPPSVPRQVFLDDGRLAAATSATTTSNGSYFYDTAAKVLYVDIGGANPGDGHTIEAGAESFGVTMTSRHDVVVRNVETRRQNFAGVRVLTSTAVTLDAVSSFGSASNGVLVDGCAAGNVLVSGVTVSRALSSGIRLSASSGVAVRGSTSNHNGLHGIALSTSSNNLIDQNTSYGNVSVNPNATSVGIDVNTTSPDNTVSNNVVYQNQDTGIQVYNSSHRTLVTRNVSHDNGDHGFDTLGSTLARYVNNTAYGNRRDGISVEGSSTGATVTNNVMVNNGTATNGHNLYVDSLSVSGFSSDYTMAFNHGTTPSVKYAGTVYRKLAGFTSATGHDSHGYGLDPDFVNPTDGDFRLTPGSAGVDSANASVSGFTGTDRAGNPLSDDQIVPDTGAGSPTYADRGALEQQAAGGQTNYPPHAALFLDPPTGTLPPSTPILADASGSNDADQNGIATYTFDFGDGTVIGPQPSATATHRYGSVGSYLVTLTVRDGLGATDVATSTATVTLRTLQTYYVERTSSACSDLGPGSQATPFCTITAAGKKLLAGDTALVGPGQYREQVSLPLTATGEPGAPITLRATSPDTVILGSEDLSNAAGWSSTATKAWSHAFSPPSAPSQVWLDGQPLVKALSAAKINPESWFYDAAAAKLYVNVGGRNPAVGHTVAAGARNFGLLLRGIDHVDVSGFKVRQTNLAGVFLDNTDQVTLSDVDVAQAGSHGITVDGSRTASLQGIESNFNASTGVRFFNTTDSSLRSATTHHNQYHGVSVQQSTRVTISGVTSRANLKPGTRVAAGIDVSSSSADTVVELSTTHNNDDSGIQAYTGSVRTVVRRNLTYDNGDHGIDISAAPNSLVVSNTVVGNNTAGINFEGGSTGGTSRNNVTADNAVGSTRTVGEIRVDAASAAGVSLNRDLVFQSSGGTLFEWASKSYKTVGSFQAASGQEPNGLGANPLFVSLAGRNLHLTSTSPGLDAAFTGLASWLRLDRDGSSPVNHPFVTNTGTGPDLSADLGAFEYVGPAAALTATPLSGYRPHNVSVDATGSQPLGAPIAGYTIACGNGTSLNQGTGTCAYPTAGTYTLTATVRDAAGLTDTQQTTVTVLADVAPTAVLTLSRSNIRLGQSITADGSGSTSVDKSPIATYRFDCGNGQVTGQQVSPVTTCTYPFIGTYTVRMWVTDTVGLVSMTSQQVRVSIL